MSGMNALPAGVGLLLAGVPPHAAATRAMTTSTPSQRNDLPLMIPPSDVLPQCAHDVPTSPPPRHDRADAVPLTVFRQVERISVTVPVLSSRLVGEGRTIA